MVVIKHRKRLSFIHSRLGTRNSFETKIYFIETHWYRYKTGNHIDAQETGFIKDISEQYPNGVLVQHGEYQYEAPNGELVKVQYTADGKYLNDILAQMKYVSSIFLYLTFYFKQ